LLVNFESFQFSSQLDKPNNKSPYNLSPYVVVGVGAYFSKKYATTPLTLKEAFQQVVWMGYDFLALENVGLFIGFLFGPCSLPLT
jgi:hypothetical protein